MDTAIKRVAAQMRAMDLRGALSKEDLRPLCIHSNDVIYYGNVAKGFFISQLSPIV